MAVRLDSAPQSGQCAMDRVSERLRDQRVRLRFGRLTDGQLHDLRVFRIRNVFHDALWAIGADSAFRFPRCIRDWGADYATTALACRDYSSGLSLSDYLDGVWAADIKGQ